METIDNYFMYNNVCLGSGSFSKVYLGHEKTNISNKVAIKVINLVGISSPLRIRVEQEVVIGKLLKEYSNKNIVNFIDVIETSEKIYIVMEYCDSGDLEKLMGQKCVSESDAKDYFKQIVNGIHHLNKLNIIHRDIKPANILLSNEKEVKIADFGLSKILCSSEDLSMTFCGSPMYMAPELLNKESYNIHADVWAIGLILYELVYGFNPFKDCKHIDTLLLSVKDNSIFFPQLNKNKDQISEECIDLLKSMLEKDLSRRITIDQVLKHKWIVGEKMHYSPVSKAPKFVEVKYLNNHYAKKDLDNTLGRKGLGASEPIKVPNTLGDLIRAKKPQTTGAQMSQPVKIPVSVTSKSIQKTIVPGSAPSGWATSIYNGLKYVGGSVSKLRGSSIYDEHF